MQFKGNKQNHLQSVIRAMQRKNCVRWGKRQNHLNTVAMWNETREQQTYAQLIQASRVSRFRVLGNVWWDRRSRKVSTNSRISAITEYSFQLRVCLPLIYAVFFHWNTSFTPFILVSNSINWWVNQFFGYLCLPRKKNAIKLYESREGCLLAKCFKTVIIPFWFLL